MSVIGHYNLRQAIEDHEVGSFDYTPGVIGEIGEKRYLKPNITRQSFTLTEVLMSDNNPNVYEVITGNVPSLSRYIKDDLPAIFTNRNNLRNLLTVISFDPRKSEEEFYVADKSFKITICRRGNALIWNRENYPDESGIGYDFENKATTSSEEYHQIMACSLNGIQLFIKYEVDGLDQISEKPVELKVVKTKPKKQFSSQITKASQYVPSKFYYLQKEKYRTYWVQMAICNVSRIILAKVFENVVVAYEDINIEILSQKAWDGDRELPKIMVSKLGKLLKWVYDSVMEGHEYELIFDGKKNRSYVLLCRKNPEPMESVDKLTDDLKSLKLGK